MSGKVVISKASAPGKAILFGEQAVVHGATAIAAALSDLRIEVDMVRLLYQRQYFYFEKVKKRFLINVFNL